MQQCMFGDCAGCCAVHSRLLLLSGRGVFFFFFFLLQQPAEYLLGSVEF